MRTTRHTKRFKDDFKRCKANPNHEEDLDGLLETVLELLENDRQLPVTNRDHQLSGKWKGYRGRWKKGLKFRECHLKPDLLLIYLLTADGKELELVRLGSHSELF